MEEREHYQREDKWWKTEYKQTVAKSQTVACMIMDLMKNTQEVNSNLWAEIKLAHKDVKLVQGEFTAEIGYVWCNFTHENRENGYLQPDIDYSQTYINNMRDGNQTNFDNMNTTVIQLSQFINAALKTMKSMEDKLQQLLFYQSKQPPPKKVVRQTQYCTSRYCGNQYSHSIDHCNEYLKNSFVSNGIENNKIKNGILQCNCWCKRNRIQFKIMEEDMNEWINILF